MPVIKHIFIRQVACTDWAS